MTSAVSSSERWSKVVRCTLADQVYGQDISLDDTAAQLTDDKLHAEAISPARAVPSWTRSVSTSAGRGQTDTAVSSPRHLTAAVTFNCGHHRTERQELIRQVRLLSL